MKNKKLILNLSYKYLLMVILLMTYIYIETVMNKLFLLNNLAPKINFDLPNFYF